MIEVLEKNKNVTMLGNCIRVSALVSIKSFETVKDKPRHARYFAEHHMLFVGVATLRDGDTSNELEAKRIAEAKMERAYYKHIKRCQREVMRDCIHTFNQTAIDLMEDTEKNLSHINTHIKAIVDRLK